MTILQRTYMLILNPIFLVTGKINEKIRSFIIYVCAFLLMSSYIIWASRVFLGIEITQQQRELIGAGFLFLIIVMSIRKKLKLVRWNTAMLILWFGCTFLIVISSFFHPVGDGFLTMAIIMGAEFPCLYFVWHNRSDYKTFFRLLSMAFAHALLAYFILLLLFVPLGVSEAFNGRYAGSTYNPNSLGILCVAAVACSLYLITFSKKSTGLYIAIAGVASMELVFTVSRAALLILLVQLLLFTIYFFIHIFNKQWGKLQSCIRIAALYSVLVLCTVIVPYSITHTSDVYAAESEACETEAPATVNLQRFGERRGDLDAFSSGRLTVWDAYLQELNVWGNDSTQRLYIDGKQLGAHNSPLEIAYRSGIPAGILYLILEICAGIFIIWLLVKKRPEGWEVFPILAIAAFGMYSFLDVVVLPFDKVPVFLFYCAIMPMFKNPRLTVKEAARGAFVKKISRFLKRQETVFKSGNMNGEREDRMQRITDVKEFDGITDNTIIGQPTRLYNSSVEFHGKGNLLFIDENVPIANTSIRFLGDNSIAFLSSNTHSTRVKLDIFNNSVFYLGRDANTTRPLHVIVSERRHIIIGDDCLFSRDIWFRNADPHLLYDSQTKKRINPTKSIFLGDHVWIAQNVMISKGTKIGSGSVIGSWSMTGGKELGSNCTWGGTPVKKLRENIFWAKPCVHGYNARETKLSQNYEGDEFIFAGDNSRISFDTIEKEINSIKAVEERLTYLKEKVHGYREKNRFYIPAQPVNAKSGIWVNLKHALSGKSTGI